MSKRSRERVAVEGVAEGAIHIGQDRGEVGPRTQPEDHRETFQHEECDPVVDGVRGVHGYKVVHEDDH